MPRWSEASASLVVAWLVACGSSPLRTVPTGEHPTDAAELTIADYPPPPAKIELPGLPPVDDPQCGWVDGYWAWSGRRWEWVAGAWVLPPAGCYYANRIIMVWVAAEQGSVLYYGQPRWYRREPQASQSRRAATDCPKPRPCVAHADE